MDQWLASKLKSEDSVTGIHSTSGVYFRKWDKVVSPFTSVYVNGSKLGVISKYFQNLAVKTLKQICEICFYQT